MRVLHLDAAREWRGGQTQLRLLLRHAPGEHAVLLPAAAPLRRALDCDGARVIGEIGEGWLASTAPLRAAARAFAPDLVAAHTPKAHAFAVRAGLPMPVIVHRRVDFRPGRDPLTRARYAAATGYIAVSRAVGDVLVEAGIPPQVMRVVHDGVDLHACGADLVGAAALRQTLGLPASTLLIGAVGALVPHKGHVHLIDAMARLMGERPDLAAVIAGEGPERGRLERRIARTGAPVRLLGQRSADGVRAVLGAVEILVHPSLTEGLGQAVIEAMAAGVPVIASAAGGLPEVVRDGETGVLVPPGHAVALAAAIEQVLRHRTAAQQRVERARSLVNRELGAPAMARRTVDAYAALIAPR